MSNFYQVVYALTRQIPAGQVTTYGTIAALAGSPMASRAVGYALAALSPDSDVPWQRVINREGRVSPRGLADNDRPVLQRLLLEREGVIFNADDRIDFKRFGWDGPAGL